MEAHYLSWSLDEATISSCGILQRLLAVSPSCLHCSTLACGKKDFAQTEQMLQSSHFPPERTTHRMSLHWVAAVTLLHHIH